MSKKICTLGHSPDPDDAFMFYAMAEHKIDLKGYEFEHILQDIQTLNERAMMGELDISAISIHAYPWVQEHYALMPCGASMGDNYGPMLVAKRRLEKSELYSAKIAIPGKLTSAFLALQLYLDRPAAEIHHVVTPFDQIPEAVRTGAADVGLLIHEGQLTYEREGLQLCEDLGCWWHRETSGLPLPLGGNVIKKSFGREGMKQLTDILTESIRYGLEHRGDAVEHSMPLGRGLDRELTDRFVGMYVNELTLDYGERGRQAIREFLGRARDAGFIGLPVEIEFCE